jgi:hypothetical protein
MKWHIFLFALVPFAFVVPSIGAQSVTVTTPDPVSGVVETTEDTLRDLPQPGSVDDSAGAALDSGTTLARPSPGKTFRSRFDRLPRPLEKLLERIELGRNVSANLRRLEQALASASIRERARLLRFLNAEIRRLRANGVSAVERRRIDRLMRTRATITALSGPARTSTVSGATDTSANDVAPGTGPRIGNGVLRAFLDGGKAQATTPPRDGAGEPAGPSETSAFPLLRVLLVALSVVLLVIVGGLAIKEERAA